MKNLLSKLMSNSGQANASTSDDGSDGKQAQSQPQQVEKLSGLIDDIDLSDVPEEQREAVAKYVSEKVKQYDAGFRSKTEDLSKERKTVEEQKQQVRELMQLRDEIDGNSELKDQITKMINNARAGLPVVDKKETSKALKKLDKYIEAAPDAETRESLNTMREIINDEIKDLRGRDDELKSLKEEIKSLRNATQMSQAERVDAKINGLKDRFGKEVVEKYEQDIRSAALKYTGQDPEKLFKYVASDEDLSAAYIKLAETKIKREQELKEEGSTPSGHGVRTPLDVKKDKFGRTDIKDLVGKMLAKK